MSLINTTGGPSSNPYPTLREKQKNSLKVMINLNEPVNPAGNVALAKRNPVTTSEPIWKLLVFDRTGQDIISPILSVKELRELGVTLHVLIESDRDAIPDVPVIYFVCPTDANVSRICNDFKNQLYDHHFLNFITPISRSRLEELANTAFQANVTSTISKVIDQFTNFVSLEDEFFVLKEQDKDKVSFFALNRPDALDMDIENVITDIVEGLFSVCVTLGTVPIIRCPKGNAAEMVGLRLDKKLRETLQDSRSNLFNSSDDLVTLMPRPRPLLVILDRNMDMATPLHHTWTYQAMAHDVLRLSLNRLKIDDAKAEVKKSKAKVYDLDSSTDKFWQTHRGSPFPQVAEAVQEELDSYRSSEEEVRRLKMVMGYGDDDGQNGATSSTGVTVISDTTAKLNSAVSSLPELMEKKKIIDMHTTIATALLDQIKVRKLDTYFELEEKILSRSSASTLGQEVLDFLKDPERGSPADKLRLYLIYLLCDTMASSSSSNSLSGMTSGASADSATIEQLRSKCEEALRESGCDMKPLMYMKRWKAFSSKTSAIQATSNPTSNYGGGIKTVSMFSKLMSQGSQFVMEGVKNLVVKKHLLPFTRITDALMDNRVIQDVEDYLYLDPKSRKQPEPSTKFFVPSTSTAPTSTTPFQEAIVFVIGGGNYIEYQNLMDHVKSRATSTTSNLAGMATKMTGSSTMAGRRITYGCTNLMNADRFLEELTQLGETI